MNRLVLKITLSTALSLCMISAQAADAVAIWAENNGDDHAVFIGELVNDEWQVAERIHTDESRLITPTLGSDTKGNMQAVWSMSQGRRIVLMGSNFNGVSWSNPARLVDTDTENLAATIVYDMTDTPWIFWSSTLNGNDDIYMMRQDNTGWNEPVLVHEKNDVPDILPKAELDAQGNIVVTWQQLNTSTLTYQEQSHKYPAPIAKSGKTLIPSRARTNKLNAEDRSERSVKAAPYQDGARGSYRVSVHYPYNTKRQSDFLVDR